MGTGYQGLPSPIDNPTVWCERCQRSHKKYTFTKEDRKRIIKRAARKLQQDIDNRALELYYQKWDK